ncbi:hypothetical protein GTP58_11950 [Duganella sp. CY15W]|uniref:hypothetical protein n=1 Tax=Duganella sp. CY15W TaxID=2692172 RepID=UPI001368AD02|nr:hypothetical protein [Duganella sp. CY15W]MYM29032.1 hypothetical protein [Duganella sp. CY15W]
MRRAGSVGDTERLPPAANSNGSNSICTAAIAANANGLPLMPRSGGYTGNLKYRLHPVASIFQWAAAIIEANGSMTALIVFHIDMQFYMHAMGCA